MAQFYNVRTGDLVEAQAILPLCPKEWVVLGTDGRQFPMPAEGFVDSAPILRVPIQSYRCSPTDRWDGVSWRS